MTDLLVENNNCDDSALSSSSGCASPSAAAALNDTDTSFSSLDQNRKASEFEAELSHIHNKMIVMLIFIILNVFKLLISILLKI